MADKVTTGTTLAEDVEHPKVFPPFDRTTFAPQLVWLAITLALLYILLSRFTLPRIGEVIEERNERVQRDLDEAERLKSETEMAIADYEQALAQAKGNASAIAKATRDKLASEVDIERSRVESSLGEKIALAEKQIAETKAKALSNVGEIAAEVASAVVAKLIATDVGKDEVRKVLAQRAAE
jgi:F-type H+-transporting ATPase subunit b